ncbi:MAG: tRNA glutamyl-Q(34) synthetase GluQRS [Actinomycetes bacterium]
MTTGRFAPSPSGPLHVGNLRTALVAWCAARHDGGRFLLRVEDLTTGAAPVAEQSQLDDLAALGLDHDGAVLRQSDRTDLYEAAIAQLEAAGLTYQCVCTQAEVRREVEAAAAAPHGFADDSYPGTCRTLAPDQLAAQVRAGRTPSLRLRADDARVTAHDVRLGELTAVVDDFVLRRADGVAAYNLAVVVDDAAQGVDQVVRGDDLWRTTPRHVLLQQLLGVPTPEYLHVPLVLGADGRRLAKRHGAIRLDDLRARGVGPEEVRDRLVASLGLAAPGERPPLHVVAERFDPLAVPSDPWVWH